MVYSPITHSSFQKLTRFELKKKPPEKLYHLFHLVEELCTTLGSVSSIVCCSPA